MLDAFTIHQPETVDEASRLLMRFGSDAAIYAGGTELLVVMKERLTHFPHLVDIKRIPRLREIAFDENTRVLTIGALATHRDIERSPIVRDRFPALASLESAVANVRVRTAGTIGGNLCFADPHSDPATLLTALEAHLTLTSATESRAVPMEEFVTGVLETSRRHDEVLTSIIVPEPDANCGIAYDRIKLHERPTAAVAAVITVERGVIAGARIVAGSIGYRPQVLAATNTMLTGRHADDDAAVAAAAVIRDEVETTSDPFESERYKRQLARTAGQRAIFAAIQRATGEEGDRHAA